MGEDLEIIATVYTIEYRKGNEVHDEPVPGASFFRRVDYADYGPYYPKSNAIRALKRLISQKGKRGWVLGFMSPDCEIAHMRHPESEYKVEYYIEKKKVSFDSLPLKIKRKIESQTLK